MSSGQSEWEIMHDEDGRPLSPAEARRRLRPLALMTALLTSALFVVVYPLCNWYASIRGDVGEWYWDWEMHIPLVPFMIIPYMSIDLFFFAAPFLCTSRRELWALGWRLTAAILIAAFFFITFPLHVAFPREPVDSIFAPVFEFLWSFDQPYNAFPSLHIALAFILRWTYHRHVASNWRWLFHTWFVLVSVSTLLTHQHQVIDTVGGLILAIVVCFAIRRDIVAATRQRSAKAMSAAVRLGASAATVALIAAGISHLGIYVADGAYRNWFDLAWILMWPVFSVSIVALGYALGYPGVFRKRDGELPFTAKVVLGPYLAGLRLARNWFWSIEMHPYAEVAPGLWVGRLPSREMAYAWMERVDADITGAYVLDLTAEHDMPEPLRKLNWKNIPMLDLAPPSEAQMAEAVAFVSDAMRTKPVLIFCGLGYGRSAAVALAYLIASGAERDVDRALALLRRQRPRAVLKPEVRVLLETYAAQAQAVANAASGESKQSIAQTGAGDAG